MCVTRRLSFLRCAGMREKEEGIGKKKKTRKNEVNLIWLYRALLELLRRSESFLNTFARAKRDVASVDRAFILAMRIESTRRRMYTRRRRSHGNCGLYFACSVSNSRRIRTQIRVISAPAFWDRVVGGNKRCACLTKCQANEFRYGPFQRYGVLWLRFANSSGKNAVTYRGSS